jgi:hypothetical protein
LILAQTGCYAPGASSTSKHKSASAFPAYGRKFKPPASRVVVDLVAIFAPQNGLIRVIFNPKLQF